MTTLSRVKTFRTTALPITKIRAEVGRYTLMLIGMILGVMSYVLFQVPHDISWGGVGGIAILLNQATGMSHGTILYILGVPLLVLGFFTLGRWKFVTKAIIIFITYPLLTDVGMVVLPNLFAGSWPLTDNVLINAIVGGFIGGVSGGLIFKSGTTYPGSSVISRAIQLKTGWPISATYMLVDGGVILAMGMVVGWENALAGLIMLYIGGQATDMVLEGLSTTLTVTVVTDQPTQVTNALIAALNRGVSYWEVTGGYSGEKRFMLMSTIKRSQLTSVRAAVCSADTNAFVTVGVGKTAMGSGFRSLR